MAAMEVKVAIIGAGMAGAAAAERLYHAGLTDIVVLEAMERVGGRAHTLWLNQPEHGKTLISHRPQLCQRLWIKKGNSKIQDYTIINCRMNMFLTQSKQHFFYTSTYLESFEHIWYYD